MDIDWDGIDHVTMADPAEPLPSDLSVLSGTDAVVVGNCFHDDPDRYLDTIPK